MIHFSKVMIKFSLFMIQFSKVMIRKIRNVFFSVSGHGYTLVPFFIRVEGPPCFLAGFFLTG